MKPKLAVLFDCGAASVAELSVAAQSLCDLVLVADLAEAFVADALPVLRAIGTIVEDTGTIDETAEVLTKLGVTGIVTYADHLIARTAAIAELCGLRYHRRDTAEALRDKNLQRRLLAAAGVRTPRFAALGSAADIDAALAAVGTPSVLKPRHGGGSRSTALITGTTNAAALTSELFSSGESSLVLEECLIGDPEVAGPGWGDYVSVETAVVDGAIRYVGVTGKLPLLDPFRETGHFFPAQIPDATADEARRITGQALRALGVHTGVTHTELKLTSDGPAVIEVNGRLGGHINDLVSRATGIDMVRLAMAIALGLPAADRPAPDPRRITFQFLFLPPIDATQVAEVAGLADARHIAGVERADLLLGNGSKVSWADGSRSIVAVVFGNAPDLAGLAAVRDAVYSKLQPSYR